MKFAKQIGNIKFPGNIVVEFAHFNIPPLTPMSKFHQIWLRWLFGYPFSNIYLIVSLFIQDDHHYLKSKLNE